MLSVGADIIDVVSLFGDVVGSLVGLGILLGIGDHVLGGSIIWTGQQGNGHALIFVALSSGTDVDRPVAIDVEGDLELGDTLGEVPSTTLGVEYRRG